MNFALKNQILHLEHSIGLKPILEKKDSLDDAERKFELAESGLNKEKEEAFASILPIWGSIVEDVRTRILNYKGHLFIPDYRDVA